MLDHPSISRRLSLQAGASSILGLGIAERAMLARAAGSRGHRSVIFVFLSGGLAQHESFDPKPDAPDVIRGEFGTIPTSIPGVRYSEHLPLLAARANRTTLVRSLGHRSNDHSAGHHIMLTGRSDLPTGFNPSAPRPADHPAIAALAGGVLPRRNNLPPAIVLPDRIVHNSGRVIPGQFAGVMGRRHDPWFLEVSAFEPKAYGAYPTHEFDHQQRDYKPKRLAFEFPDLALPQGVDGGRFGGRLGILNHIDSQRKALEGAAGGFDRHRQDAVSLLTDSRVRSAFDIGKAPDRDLDLYGRNAFGWSLLMAARLAEAGVSLVQVNLGNNETWDTHGNAFPHLKDKLLPPMDKSLSALLDDLTAKGLLDSTLVVVAGEFGRTPRTSTLTKFYKGPGRDHWGAVQSVLLFGGGTRPGRVVGASDRTGGYPILEPQSPENFAATIFQALGLPSTVAWHDAENRPHHLYQGAVMPVF